MFQVWGDISKEEKAKRARFWMSEEEFAETKKCMGELNGLYDLIYLNTTSKEQEVKEPVGTTRQSR